MGYKRFTNSAAQLKPDTRFESVLVSKFINSIMWDGEKEHRHAGLLRRNGYRRQARVGSVAARGV